MPLCSKMNEKFNWKLDPWKNKWRMILSKGTRLCILILPNICRTVFFSFFFLLLIPFLGFVILNCTSKRFDCLKISLYLFIAINYWTKLWILNFFVSGYTCSNIKPTSPDQTRHQSRIPADVINCKRNENI